MADYRKSLWEMNVIPRNVPLENDPGRRAVLAAEIDMLVARDVYGLTKREMLYILDPTNIFGADCALETFNALRNSELREFNEFRTSRLIMEAWDRLEFRCALGAA